MPEDLKDLNLTSAKVNTVDTFINILPQNGSQSELFP
jgi:hypothetical protein